MAALSSALNYAVSGLKVTAAQSALVSRNIANASDPDYSRKSALVVSLPGGSVSVASYNRSADKRLLDKLLDVTSSSQNQQAILDALTKLSATVGDPQSDVSIHAMLGKLQRSLQQYESDPANPVLGGQAVAQAGTMARSLNDASAAVQALRQQADAEMAASVDRINALLNQFKVVNDAVVRGTGTASDLADTLDQRDRILKQLSEEIGIRTVTRPNNDIAIYSDGGVTLFETNSRTVSMEPTLTFDAGVAGKAVYADGVKIAGGNGPMASTTGKLQGYAEVRDRIAVTYQMQLDEVARGLIEMFSESDQQPVPTLPAVAGLFTYAGGPAVPASGTVMAGLSATIRVNPLADPAQGGDPALLRDGGFGGPAYVYNTGGDAGYQERLSHLVEGFDATRSFDPAARAGSQTTILSYGAASAGWLEGLRQTADQKAEYGAAVQSRASDALLRVTGVNIDEEMAIMLDLEKSYQASSKVISAVDSMLENLLQAVG